MARYLHAGCGLTANMTVPLAHNAAKLDAAVTIERTA